MRPLLVFLVFLSWGYPQEWVKEQIDTCDFPAYPIDFLDVSLATNRAGSPCVAYGWLKWRGDSSLWAIRYAERRGMNEWHIEMVDSSLGLYIYNFPSLRLDSLDRPHIAYLKSGANYDRVVYATRADSSWLLEDVDSVVSASLHTVPNLALSATGVPHLAYHAYDTASGLLDLRYALRWADSWQIQVLWRSDTRRAWGGTIALGRKDRPSIAFASLGQGTPQRDSLLYLWRDSTEWHTSIVDTPYYATLPSMQLDSMERPRLVYTWDGTAVYAFLEDSTWHLEWIPANFAHEMKLDSRELPHVAAFPPLLWLPFYYYKDLSGSWHEEGLEKHPAIARGDPSVALDQRDAPYVAYWFQPQLAQGPGYLVVAHKTVGVESPFQHPLPSPQFVVFPSISRQFCFLFSAESSGNLKIYTSHGSLVFARPIPLGLSSWTWHALRPSGKPLPKGIYFARFESGPLRLSRKLVIQ
ncbi:MAG: hypothetical protein ABIK44_01825 [candidate division WOR-3 bacterium]